MIVRIARVKVGHRQAYLPKRPLALSLEGVFIACFKESLLLPWFLLIGKRVLLEHSW
jgi:hypothetical protein